MSIMRPRRGRSATTATAAAVRLGTTSGSNPGNSSGAVSGGEPAERSPVRNRHDEFAEGLCGDLGD